MRLSCSGSNQGLEPLQSSPPNAEPLDGFNLSRRDNQGRVRVGYSTVRTCRPYRMSTVPRTSRCSTEYVLRKPCNEETKLWPGSQRPSGHHPVQHSRRPTTRHRAPLPHREMPLRQAPERREPGTGSAPPPPAWRVAVRQAPERREASRWTTGRISDYLRRDQKMIRQAR